ncbi:hypothetical protein DL765_002892 [Monosporascus sp. GIB2]|nr:hypothetical protein DL765_002892 [Monosporascus sp. GIB2]
MASLRMCTHKVVSIYVGRGVLIESDRPTLFSGGGSEHAQLYQWQLLDASKVVMGHVQTETPYYQDNPTALEPYTVGEWPADPDFEDCAENFCKKARTLRILKSSDVFLYGLGFYSFSKDNNLGCALSEECQLSFIETKHAERVWMYNIFTKGNVEVVSPEGGIPPLLFNVTTRNGYTSNVAAWLALALGGGGRGRSLEPGSDEGSGVVYIDPGLWKDKGGDGTVTIQRYDPCNLCAATADASSRDNHHISPPYYFARSRLARGYNPWPWPTYETPTTTTSWTTTKGVNEDEDDDGEVPIVIVHTKEVLIMDEDNPNRPNPENPREPDPDCTTSTYSSWQTLCIPSPTQSRSSTCSRVIGCSTTGTDAEATITPAPEYGVYMESYEPWVSTLPSFEEYLDAAQDVLEEPSSLDGLPDFESASEEPPPSTTTTTELPVPTIPPPGNFYRFREHSDDGRWERLHGPGGGGDGGPDRGSAFRDLGRRSDGCKAKSEVPMGEWCIDTICIMLLSCDLPLGEPYYGGAFVDNADYGCAVVDGADTSAPFAQVPDQGPQPLPPSE